MDLHFWRFASTLEKGFHVPYNRDKEVVICPECKGSIIGDEWKLTDYASLTEDGYLMYRCPICKKELACKAIEY